MGTDDRYKINNNRPFRSRLSEMYNSRADAVGRAGYQSVPGTSCVDGTGDAITSRQGWYVCIFRPVAVWNESSLIVKYHRGKL